MAHPYANFDEKTYLLAILLQVTGDAELAQQKLAEAKELLKYPPTPLPTFKITGI